MSNSLNHNVKVSQSATDPQCKTPLVLSCRTSAKCWYACLDKGSCASQLALWWSSFENASASVRSGDIFSAFIYLLTGRNSIVGYIQGVNGIMQVSMGSSGGCLPVCSFPATLHCKTLHSACPLIGYRKCCEIHSHLLQALSSSGETPACLISSSKTPASKRIAG